MAARRTVTAVADRTGVAVAADAAQTTRRPRAVPYLRGLPRSVAYLASGFTAGLYGLVVLAFLLFVAALSVVGVGLLLAGVASVAVRHWCDRERARTGRLLGERIASPYVGRSSTAPSTLHDHVSAGAFARDLATLLHRIVIGIPLGVLVVALPLVSLNSAVIPLYWWALSDGNTTGSAFTVTTWWDAIASGALGLAGLVVWSAAPAVAGADARIAAQLLSRTRDQELGQRARIEEHRRRSAVSAHTAELRRIERDLHDATQNRLVAVSMFVGMAQRRLATRTGDVAQVLAQAQDASRDALADMRRVIRGIYPPTLAEEGLVPAVGALVDAAHIPTRLHIQNAASTPAAVDAALYFSIAESLTNVAKHSSATRCDVHLCWERAAHALQVTATVTDDGRGGADAAKGSGLAGIASRLEALGGALDVTSPTGGPTSVRMSLPCAP